MDIPKTLQRDESCKVGSIDQRLRDARHSSRVGSPLHPIPRNVAPRPENAPSPFHKDSPTKGSTTSRFSNPPSSQQTPCSTLPADVKRLVNLYLKQPFTIAPYSRRVAAAKNQNGVATMEYIDRAELPPRGLKEEREKLLVMDQAYGTLIKLEEEYRASTETRKELKRRLCGELDTEDDSNTLEHIAALTHDIGRIEKEVGRQLINSGAINDGFGTDETIDILQDPPPPSSKAHDGTAPRASGTSTIGSAQVILQTQIPSLPQRSIDSTNYLPLGRTIPQSSSRGFPDQMPSNASYPTSPSPIRHAIPVKPTTAHQISFGSRENSTLADKAIRQPNFIRDPSPVNYDFDDDAFDNLLLEEQEIQDKASRKGAFDDDYGDFGDDDDLLEMADAVEKGHSLPEPTSRQSTRKIPSDASENIASSRNRDKPNANKNMYSHVDTAHSQMLKYAWSNDVKKALKERFKLSGFRQNQLDAINATLNAEDAFVLMPTGGGKSLCYQLPAIIQSGKTKGVTIVISPLLSLMIDQVGHLQAINIRAATLNGETSSSERHEIFDQLSENHPEQYIQLLYITPEMIGKSEKMLSTLSRLHANKKLARIVIDEAHCVSQWGHDFRPDYVALKQVRERFPRVPLMALTATATENVKLDVMHNLGMGKCPVYSQSFNRPNIHYEIRWKKGKGKAKEILDEIAGLIKNRYRGQTGIIYTLSRKNCEQIAEKLSNDYGISAHHYHASLPPEDKKAIQEDWQRGVLQVVVATIAFGMGIDKPDVRFVIHHTIPKSLEGYYQETGRAGRDGQKSECLLYYGYQDTAVLKDFIYKSEASEEQKERQRKMLTSMVRYCENRSDCRRVQVLAYFGESFEKRHCGHSCDNCNSKAVFQTIDFTSEAQAAIRIVKQLQKSNVTLLHCVDILRGSNAGKIKTLSHNQLSEFGFAKNMDRSDIERLFFRLLMENALEEHNVMNKSGFATAYIHLGPNCREFHTGRRHISLQIKISGSPPGPARKQQPSKQATKQSSNTRVNYPSTHFTSPISSPSKGKGKNTIRPAYRYGEDDNTTDDDFVVDDDNVEVFEPMRKSVRNCKASSERLGPPITADRRLAALPEVHRDIIQHFTDEAKELEERLRNRTQAKKPFFTESNFREMAIEWTTSIKDMRDIPGINIERVDKYGLQFIPMIQRYYRNYEEMMNSNMPQNRDIDTNHRNVIDLVSDEEEETDGEEDFGTNDDDDDDDDDPDIRAAEQGGSKYFQTSTTKTKGTRKIPWGKDASTGTTEKRGDFSRGGGGYSARGIRSGRGGKKSFARGSYRSTSGSSAVSKRRSSGGGKKGRGSKPTGYAATRKNNSGLMQQFGHSGGGGIGMMPT
ncbi:P-loop containing nucleoside triphosphate hydrolase protein [Tricladium varicosporioides]|nr:P-loop containing nucleoside triphosphate hydrolase protein [Hymenoscyphus varicosporioides]